MGPNEAPGQVVAFTRPHRAPSVRASKRSPTPALGPAALSAMPRGDAIGEVEHLADVVGLALAQRFGGQVVWRRTMQPAETGLHLPSIAELLASGRMVRSDWRGKLIAELDGDEVRALVGRHL